MLEAVEPLFQCASHPNFRICSCKLFHAPLARTTPGMAMWCESSVQICSCSELRRSQGHTSCSLLCRCKGTGQQHFDKRHLIGRHCLLSRLAAVRRALPTSLRLLGGRLARRHIVPLCVTRNALCRHIAVPAAVLRFNHL